MKNYSIERYNTKLDWLKARGIGGSSAAAVMGMSKWQSKLDVYMSFNKLISPDEDEEEKQTESQLYGTLAEDLIRQMFKLDYKGIYDVQDPNGYEMYRDKETEFLTATVDGLLIDCTNGENGILEIKTHDISNSEDYEEWNNHIPQYYYIQCLHYLNVLQDKKFVILCAKLRFFNYTEEGHRYLFRQEIRYYRIDKEDEQVKKDLAYEKEKVLEFVEKHLIENQIPNSEVEI